MHRVLTVLQKLPNPCRVQVLENLVQHTPQTPLYVEQTKKGREADR